jgi:hypothetical protein
MTEYYERITCTYVEGGKTRTIDLTDSARIEYCNLWFRIGGYKGSQFKEYVVSILQLRKLELTK